MWGKTHDLPAGMHSHATPSSPHPAAGPEHSHRASCGQHAWGMSMKTPLNPLPIRGCRTLPESGLTCHFEGALGRVGDGRGHGHRRGLAFLE